MWYEKQQIISSFSFQNKEKRLSTFSQESFYYDNTKKQIITKNLSSKNKQFINKQRLQKDFSHSYLLKALNENQKKQRKLQSKTHDSHKSLLPKINQQVYKNQRNSKIYKIDQTNYCLNRIINKNQHCKINNSSLINLANSKTEIKKYIQQNQNKIKTAELKYLQLQKNKYQNIDINEQQYLKKKSQNNLKQKENNHHKRISNNHLPRAISESSKLFTNIVIKKSLERNIQNRKQQLSYFDLKQIKLNQIQFPVTRNISSSHISPHIADDKLNNYDLLESFYKKIKDKENQQRKKLKRNCKFKQLSVFQLGIK